MFNNTSETKGKEPKGLDGKKAEVLQAVLAAESGAETPKKKPSRRRVRAETVAAPTEGTVLNTPAPVTEKAADKVAVEKAELPKTGEVKDNALSAAIVASKPAPKPVTVSVGPADEYSLVLYWDKQQREFIGYYAEFPEIQVHAARKDLALLELEDKLETHLVLAKRDGQSVPESISQKVFPESVQIPLSQSVFRKLEVLSKIERASVEKLAAELLVQAIEKRVPGGAPRHSQEARRSGNSQQQSSQSQHRNPQHQGRRNGNSQGRGYNEAMENRENFMEYVRNLEKGGWRKK